jgi:hypothetical protein
LLSLLPETHDHDAAKLCRAARHDPLRIRDSVTQSKQRVNSGSLQVPLGHQDVIRHCSQAPRALTNSQASLLIDGPIQAIVFTLLKLSIQHSCWYSSLLLGTRRHAVIPGLVFLALLCSTALLCSALAGLASGLRVCYGSHIRDRLGLKSKLVEPRQGFRILIQDEGSF